MSAAARVHQTLVGYYGLPAQPPVGDFIDYRRGVRERVLVREADDALEVRVELPEEAEAPANLDVTCQLIEGVSHFMLIAERVRRRLPVTELELELQAEIDKFVLLAVARTQPLHPLATARLRRRLFDAPLFLHEEGEERGDRYRLANRIAGQLAAHIDVAYLRRRRARALRRRLRRFFGEGQTAKLELARAA